MTAERAIAGVLAGGRRLADLRSADGHAASAHYQALQAGTVPRELADLAHFLCLLHGRRPGVLDHAAAHDTHDAARAWMVQATQAFVTERLYITRMTVAAGPVSGASPQDRSEAAAVELRRSFQMLASSERRGCAAGAALAFAIDWPALRDMLDPLALRLGIDPPWCELPPAAQTLALADRLCGDPASARAFLFGADQMFQLHRGVWRLLAARARLRAEQA